MKVTEPRAAATYVSPGLQGGGIDGVLVEASPLLKCGLCLLVVLLGVPGQQLRRVFHANALAKALDDGTRVVKQVVSVNDANVDRSLIRLVLSIGVAGTVGRLSSDLGTNLTNAAQVIEYSTLLVVTCLLGHEVVEASDIVKRGHCASEVTWNAVLGVPDQEGKVKLLQHIGGNDGRVSGLRFGVIWVWSTSLCRAIDTIGSNTVCANAALDRVQRRCDRGRLS